MIETVFDELKRYVGFGSEDEAALRALHPAAHPHFLHIADVFYDRIVQHDEARAALEGGESHVGRLKVTLVAWLDTLLKGPWDDEYFQRRCRIGRVHVRINLPQHYMFGAMNIVRDEIDAIIYATYGSDSAETLSARRAIGKVLDIELAIMLHTYREDILTQQARVERLATFGQLLGFIGHELRNPLGVIETEVYILKNRNGGDAASQPHLDHIEEQVTFASQIIDELFELVSDKPLQRERVQVPVIVKSVLENVICPADIGIRTDGFDLLPEVSGDPIQLRQVVRNLIQNAIDAAGPRGTVIVRASYDTCVVLDIEDSGPGIDPAIRKRLFEPLTTTKTNGVGLGLALVKRIVDRHGGSVDFQSESGRGTTFTVRLPPA